MSRQLDNLRPWAAWMVRHRMAWVLMLFNLLLHVPVEIVHSAISSIPDSVRAVRDANRDIRQAAREARAERTPPVLVDLLQFLGPAGFMLLILMVVLTVYAIATLQLALMIPAMIAGLMALLVIAFRGAE